MCGRWVGRCADAGILFHLLIFFEIPYSQFDDVEQLRAEIATFQNLSQYVLLLIQEHP